MSEQPVAVLVVTVLLLVVPATISILVFKHAQAREADNPAAWGAVVWLTGGLAAIVYLVSTLLPDPDVPEVHAAEQDGHADAEE
jgi:hypothetical protein